MKLNKLKVLVPFIAMGIITITGVSYGDVKVNVNDDKTEAYSYNSNETVNVDIPDNIESPLSDDSDKNYKSDIDNDYSKGYESEIDSDSYYKSDVDSDKDSNDYNKENVYDDIYDSDVYYSNTDDEYYAKKKDKDVIDIEDDNIPTVDSYRSKSKKNGMKDDVIYEDEYYEEKLLKNNEYEILSRDMVVQKNVAIDEKSKIRYTTLPEGSTVELLGFTNQNGKKLVELMTDSKKVYYEDIVNFYHNSILSDTTPFKRSMKTLVNDARMRGTETGYNTCVAVAILFMLGTIFLVNFLDSNVFRLKDGGDNPYINSIARVMPGAMIGSFLIIANMFDKNAVDYYLYKGFNLLGRNYEFIHWIMQFMLAFTIFMIVRLIIEGLKCFTLPCMIIRTIILLAANLASFYLCYGLSYVGVAIYAMLILYQCICVNTYECADIGEESADEGEDEGEESDDSGESEGEPEPEAL